MSKIKTREVVKGTIKTIDKGKIATERTKDNIVNIKEKGESGYNSDNYKNVNDYAINKLETSGKVVIGNSGKIKSKGNEAVRETNKNIIKTKAKIKNIKTKLSKKRTIKSTTKGIKTSSNIAKKEAKKVAKESVKASQRAAKLARETAKKTYQGVKLAVKATISTIKAIIVGTKALISALIAGGWIALIIIVVICSIGLLFGSVFGIFFSSDTGSNNGITMNNVIKEINKEMSDKIENIKNTNEFDDYVIESDRAEWKGILSIYSVKITKGTHEVDVITIDDIKKSELKKVFWDFHEITYEVKNEMSEEQFDKEMKNILYIKIKSKTLDEMMIKYGFNQMQKKQVSELLDDEYSIMWSSVIFGTSLGSPNMVQIALSQVGNVGGEPYWRWYGFNSRVEWCAIFVSWVANQSGYIDAGVIPKFSGCQNGIDWFKAMGEWQEKDYIPKAGDIIFFDWEVDGQVNHVGIVEKVENNKIYTIEGNSTDDTCRQKVYSIGNKVIFGYGTPQY